MRRTLTVALALLAAWMALPTAAGARPTLTCGTPTHLNMTNGSYTTSSTIQFSGTDFVQMDAWSPDTTTQQSMDVCSISSWSATVSENGATQVHTYPDSEYRFTDYIDCSHSPREDSFAHLTGTWDLTSPGSITAVWDDSWDLFFGGPINGHDCGPFREVMVWTKWKGQGHYLTTRVNHTTADGTNYDFGWTNDGALIQVYPTTQADAGTTHLKQILDYLTTQTLPDGTTPVLFDSSLLHFVQYGPEVVSTAGVSRTWTLNGFGVTAN